MLQIKREYAIIKDGHQIRRWPIWLHGQAVKTSPFHGGNPGSIPGGVINADVAQLAEQLICNQQVIGSSPIIGLVL